MSGPTKTESLLSTKLHRPLVGRDHVQRQYLLERLEKNRRRPLTLVSAPAGYGKSTLVSSWLEACECPGGWVSLDKNDNNLVLFLCYCLAAVQRMFPDAGRKTLSMVNAPTLAAVSTLASSLINELEMIEQPFILVLDDYHHIQDESVHELLNQLLHHPPQSIHLVLIGRRDAPLPISMLRAQGLVTEIRTRDLRFTSAETMAFLNQLLRDPIDTAVAAALGEKTEGWVTGLRLAALSMRHRGDIDPRLIKSQADEQYVMEYLFDEVFSHHPPEMSRYLLGTAILDCFCGQLCEAVCVPGVDPFACETGGWDFIAWLKRENVFLIPLDSENRWFRYHHLFQKLLLNQLNRRCSAEEIKAIHAQASTWFAENDRFEEALRHAMAAGSPETAGSLVARFSCQLMNDQQWPRLERCLRMLSQDQIERDIALLVLESWVHHVRQNFSGMVSCIKKIEALKASSPHGAGVNVKHVEGHFDALRGFLHYMAAEGEAALASCRRALRDLPRHHKRARLFADIYQLVAYQMTGNFETGLLIYQEAMRRYSERDQIYHATYLGNLGHVYWMDANLAVLHQTAQSLLDLIKKHVQPATVPYGLYFLGIIHYHRNELQYAEEKLVEVLETYHAASPMNFAHSAFALALTYQARGKPDQAREICNSVVVDALETNNEDMLQVARAFEAELALRQGRLAEVFRWAEKYQAKPFRPTFRFYMPQITAAKILLVQDSMDSRRRAADLLDQLHDFLTSIHNIRFQIDVLALQALLHDARGEESAALEKLTEAFVLTEPGGFIRIFVDLGPKMADLVKLLIKRNVAVGYAGRILAAFSEDKPSLSPSPGLSVAPHVLHRLESEEGSPGHSTFQPLIDPLTNREHEILELLARRLQNKEMAARLYISPQTIKKHLNHIYGKLSVSGRHEAVEKARKIGILSG